jgi:hypothetical protein
VIGTGTGYLPVMEKAKHEAKRCHIKLPVLPTAEAIEPPKKDPPETAPPVAAGDPVGGRTSRRPRRIEWAS